ncbi:MAG: DUF1467 family protein [Pseudomonadota bacterium]
MTLTSGVVLFAVIWFMVLFMVLPLFVRSQEEAGEVEPGTPAGAPDQPMMRKKLVWTTVASVAIWIVAFLVIESGVITVADIADIFGRPE